MDAAPSPVAITDDSFLSPTGALLSADTERVSDGLLFQLLGKVGRRRHVPYANVLLAESHPPEAIEEKTTGKICRRRQKEKRLRGKDTTGERSTKFRKKGLTFLSYLL